jgi:hypothetical protein
MTARQRERKNSLSSWGQQAVSVITVVGLIWGGLWVHMPEIVAAAVQHEMKSQVDVIRAHTDSAKTSIMDSVRVELRNTVRETTDQIGLIAMEQDGHTVYSPRIVVQADTMGLKLVNARLDTLGREVDGLNRSVNFIVNLPLFQAAKPAHNRRPK